MKPRAFTLKEKAGEMPAGTTVYECSVHDYGLARDDANLTGIEHKSVTLDPNGGWPTFSVPVRILREIPRTAEAPIPQTENHAVEHVVNAVMGPATTAAQLESLLAGMVCAADVADVLMFFRKLGMLESSAKEAVKRLIHNPVKG